MQAGFLREQVCKYMCPYARFQGVMFDSDTLIISYDSERGEPRGPRRKGAGDAGRGDCVDCGICVQVCPTGIDIRNGLQYECIGCAACIDACDEVMGKIGHAKGLVRYSTENALAGRYPRSEMLRHVLRPRIVVYTAILLVIVMATAWSLAARVPLKVDVIRDRSILAREANDGRIENVYNLKIMNTSEEVRRFDLSVAGLDGLELLGVPSVEVGAAENREITVTVRAPQGAGRPGANNIFFDIKARGRDEVAVHEKASFMIP